ncbi:endonuclease/exonuclease/phosphatase family protein [Parabacteroides pacaensis]|uniref:endonuclease/exonuclease/phosphatase family protein n=1 Tax=Parabacteroides pacaensis TaxID=2086575 RepID=UPI000D10903D|nr:endonuclease/exonuclease/phosphatase family protein [Parabacteroides pacaensis]
MKYLSALLIVLLLCPGRATGQDKTRLKVMTYNLRFGELASLKELGEFIKSENPDVVFLQEVDVRTQRKRAPRQNGKNFISELGYYTEMMSLFGKSINYEGGYYGLGILSKYPFSSSRRMDLPMVEAGREQRSLLTATVVLDNGEEITVASTHLDLKPEIRLVQAEAINEMLRKSSQPVLLGGDFNARPQSPEIAQGMSDWQRSCPDDVYTIPAKAPKSKIDYLFSFPRNRWKVIQSYVPEVFLSDHRPVVAVIELIK